MTGNVTCRSIHRLLKLCTFGQAHNRDRYLFIKRSHSRTFFTASVKSNENEGESSDSPRPVPTLKPRQALLLRGRRPLSPLERISSLLPQDALSPEVVMLREQDGAPSDNLDTPSASDSGEPHVPLMTLPRESVLTFGELLIGEYQKKRVQFRKMFQLQPRARLQSSWGVLQHDNLAGQPAGSFLKTNRGVSIFVRRASLEDYVLHMKRGPAISYPKDAALMLLMMDVTEGDCVLESGSGSGAMSLFLSRAVGSKGSVLSLEVRDDHHSRAVLNYERWRASWRLRRGEGWPDNVHFHKADLCAASSLLAGRAFNAVALDLINPQLALPTVVPHLHAGAVCTVYLANITQVIDLLESLRCSALPLVCERIVELPIRDWVVAPARQKDGQYCSRRAPNLEDEPTQEDKPEDSNREGDFGAAFGTIPYIARPHAVQMSHTAFLVKLRKFVL